MAPVSRRKFLASSSAAALLATAPCSARAEAQASGTPSAPDVTSGSATKRTGAIGRQEVHAEDAALACSNRAFTQRWLEALCRGSRDERRISVRSQKPFKETLSFANRPIRINGRPFDSGLALLTDDAAEIRSGTPITRFRALVGLDDNAVARRMVLTSVVFSVEAGGRELWRSTPMGPADPAQAVDVPLDGVRSVVLKAVMVSPSARALSNYWAHADFADAAVDIADRTTLRVARTLE